MGGIGKTTLARQVYNHDLIIHHFDRLAWVCVSQQFTRKYVWQAMLRKLNPKYDEHMDSDMTEDQLQDKLVRFLETGKYFIVLDDVWTREDWNKIKHVFPPKKGWKVLITSRKEDMMREVCLLKAKEENFLQILNTVECSSSQSPYKSRRLVVHWSDAFHDEGEINNPKLRALLLVWESAKEGWKLSGSFLARLKTLRVLDLSRAKFHGEKLPSDIGKLVHLRYLSLYKARFTHLPSSLRNLKLLLYLNLYVFSKTPIYVPNVLKDMRELKYLSLPGRMHEKTKLELGNLVNLESLEYFSTEHCYASDLHGMTRLETLSIYVKGKSGCNMETLSSSLHVSRYLKELTIHDRRDHGLTGDAGEFVLDCVSLNKLNLSVYMPKLPDGQRFPSHLTSVTLSHCCLEEDPMPVLAKFLHLSEVSLGARAFAGKRIVCSGNGFPKLEHLVLTQQLELEEWKVEQGSMPRLHTLIISQCENLKELPHGLRLKILQQQQNTRHWLIFDKDLIL
ncbi:hypothetical protein Bca4012_029421 [Brassica carinata]